MYIPGSKEEADYLAAYNPSKYPNPAVAVDLALYAYDKTQKVLKVLLIRRGGFPYKGYWAFPGGFINIKEHIDVSVRREMLEETGIADADCVQYFCMGAPDRDPRQRVITPEYVALTSLDSVKSQAGDDAAEAVWYTVSEFSHQTKSIGEKKREERFTVKLSASETFTVELTRQTEYAKTRRIQDFEVEGSGLAFDHAQVVVYSLLKLRELLLNTDIAYNVFPDGADKAELESLYNAAFIGDLDVSSLKGIRKTSEGKWTFLPDMD